MAENDRDKIRRILRETSEWREDPLTRLITLVEEMRKNEDKWVSQDDFLPVKRLVYGLVALLGGGIVMAIIKTVLR